MELDSNSDFIITNSHKLLCSFVPQFPLWEWSVFLDEFCLYKKTLLVAIKGGGRETLASNSHLITAAGVFPSWALGKLKQTKNREEVFTEAARSSFLCTYILFLTFFGWRHRPVFPLLSLSGFSSALTQLPETTNCSFMNGAHSEPPYNLSGC